jgi:hypothetical protein
VSSTILVVIVLVVMWLVVLVPMFVRRHEDTTDASDASDLAAQPASRTRVLARRTPSTRGTRPYRHRPADHHADADAGWPGIAASAFSREQARHRMLRRRRRTLLLLITVTGLGFTGATLVTAWFWILQALGTVLLVGYAGWLRQQVRRERARRLRRAALSAGTRPAPFPAPLGRLRTSRMVPDLRRPAPRPAARAAEPTAPAHTRGGTSTVDGAWRPVPVPVPTYVTKPAAPRTDPPVALDDDDPTFADIEPIVEPVERRRAVNG